MSARLRKFGGGWSTRWTKKRGRLREEVGVAVAAQSRCYWSGHSTWRWVFL